VSDPTELVKKFEIDKLPVDERIALIEAIWKSIDARAMHVVLPTPAEIARFHEQLEYELEDDLFGPDEEDLFAYPRDRH
jgi:putative addiction module component (TIGR02574 family)